MQIQCPHCSQSLINTPDLAGQVVACPHCDKKLTMPALKPPVRGESPPSTSPFQINPYESPQGAAPIAPDQPPRSYTERHVKNYMAEAILCLIFCAWPLAIPAIIYAADVKTRLRRGDHRGAVRASENAKKWCIISVCVGLGIFVLVVIAGIIGEL
jgi:hypothetical protein